MIEVPAPADARGVNIFSAPSLDSRPVASGCQRAPAPCVSRSSVTRIKFGYTSKDALSLLLPVQLEAFYSIFTTEQQDHVKSVEYLRNNFRPLQELDDRVVFKSAVKDAWQKDATEMLGDPHSTEASRGEMRRVPPLFMIWMITWNACKSFGTFGREESCI